MAERSFGPVVVRRRLGSELRRLRDRAGLSLEQVARELEASPSKISRLENGQSPAKLWDVRNLLTLYGVTDDDYRRRAERWVNEGRAQGWWHPFSEASPADLDYYVSLESEAAEIRTYSTPFLYGLLQTEAYARTLLHSTLPALGEEAVRGLVDVRLRRQEAVFGAAEPIQITVILDESTLYRRVGDADLMVDQWRRVLELTDVVELRVRPLHAPPHLALQSSFTVFLPRERDIDPAVVNVESAYHDAYWEDAVEVERYVRSFDDLARTSLDRSDTKALVERLVNEGDPVVRP